MTINKVPFKLPFMSLDFKTLLVLLFVVQYFKNSNYFVINNKMNAEEKHF